MFLQVYSLRDGRQLGSISGQQGFETPVPTDHDGWNKRTRYAKSTWHTREGPMASAQASHERLTSRNKVQTGSDRAFGVTFAMVFSAIGLWPLISGTAPRLWALVLAAIFLLVALLRPTILRHPKRLWFRFGELLHRIANPLILCLLYYLTITPIALIMRLMGKDPLHLKLDSNVDNYWIARQPPGPSGESMRRQF
jgi:hypothetical protein